jgi:hypothetical protein
MIQIIGNQYLINGLYFGVIFLNRKRGIAPWLGVSSKGGGKKEK